MFQSLRDLKALKALDSEVKHSASGAMTHIKEVKSWEFICLALGQEFSNWLRPVQGLQSVKLGGLFGVSSAKMDDTNWLKS